MNSIKKLFSLLFLFAIVCSCANKKSSSEVINSVEDLRGKNVAVLIGSTQDQYLAAHYPDITPFRVEFVADIVTPVITRQVPAGMIEEACIATMTKDNPEIVAVGPVIYSDPIGIAMNDQKKVDEYNEFLAKLVASGELERIKEKWQNSNDSTTVPDLKYSGEKGEFKIMADLNTPFFYLSNGKFCGVDVEIMSRFCSEYGYIPNITTANFTTTLIAITSKKIDALCGGISVTEERKQSMLFTDPHYFSAIKLFTTIDQAPDFSNEEKSEEINISFWDKVKKSFYNNLIREERYKLILDGLKVTVGVTILSAILGTLLGGVICFLRKSKNKYVSGFANGYIQLIRGIPQLVLLMLMYYVVFSSSGLSGVLVASITFAINLSAYASEIFRSAIEGIDKGQREAGIALGFSKFQTFYYIIAPQAIRRALPVYKGEIVSLLKMTSVIGYIAVQDLTKSSDIIRSRTFDAFFPLIFVAIIYLLLAYLLTQLINLIEKKYERHN